MKISHFFWFLLISASLTAVACKDNKDTTAETPATEGEATSPGDAITIDPAATGNAGTQASSGSGSEPHYKCSKPGCTGSGAAQGKCPVCGTDLVHNQAFHAQSQLASPGTAPDNAIQVAPSGDKNAQPSQPVQQGQPVAQNAKGEYHYTCSKGHPGAAMAGNCSKCGEALTHNQKFHQE